MYFKQRQMHFEVVRLETVAERLDLSPKHLAKIVLITLQIHPVWLHNDTQTDWYFWRDVVTALGSTTENCTKILLAF